MTRIRRTWTALVNNNEDYQTLIFKPSHSKSKTLTLSNFALIVILLINSSSFDLLLKLIRMLGIARNLALVAFLDR